MNAISGEIIQEKSIGINTEVAQDIFQTILIYGNNIVIPTVEEEKFLSCFSFNNLNLQWRIKIDGELIDYFCLSEKLVISLRDRTIIANEQDQTTYISLKASERDLFLSLSNGHYLLDILSGEKREIHIPYKVHLGAKCFTENGSFNGLVTALCEEDSPSGYGDYRYPIAIYDKLGNLVGEKIYFDDPIHFFAVDSSQNIIVLSSPTIDVWERYYNDTDLHSYITAYNQRGEKLHQIVLNHPVQSVIYVTTENNICFFSNNKFCVRKIR